MKFRVAETTVTEPPNLIQVHTRGKPSSESPGLRQRELYHQKDRPTREQGTFPKSALPDRTEAWVRYYRQRNVGVRAETGRALQLLGIMCQSHLPCACPLRGLGMVHVDSTSVISST